MKTAMRLVAVAAFLVGGAAAFAGECGGFSCQNMCPLAQKANARRSWGTESPSKGALAARVEKALARV